jgi:hypothetical protein
MIEDLSWLALRVQDLARFAAKALQSEHSLDPMPFVRLGDRRQAHDVPILLRHYVAGEVLLVKSVHDQHDQTRQPSLLDGFNSLFA